MGNVLARSAPPMHIGGGMFLAGGFGRYKRIEKIEFQLDEDLQVNEMNFKGFLPNLKNLVLRSGSDPSLYPSTPEILKYLAPRLQQLDIREVKITELGVVKELFPFITTGLALELNWDHLQTLSDWDPLFLTKLQALRIHINPDDTVRVELLVWLHKWVIEAQRDILHVHIKCWTTQMQTVFSAAYLQIAQHDWIPRGVYNFVLRVEAIECGVCATNQPGHAEKLWSQFVNRETNAEVVMKFPDATPQTLPWFGNKMLSPFVDVDCLGLRSYIQLDCRDDAWDRSMKQSVDVFISNFLDWSTNAIVQKYNVDPNFPEDAPIVQEDVSKYILAVYIRLPSNRTDVTYSHVYTTSMDDNPFRTLALTVRSMMATNRYLTLGMQYDLEAIGSF